MSWVGRAAGLVTDHSRLVVAAFLVATLVVGAGASGVEESSSVAVADESAVAEASDYARVNLSAFGPNTTTAVVAVSNEDGNVLSRESLLRSLRYQKQLRVNETINETLVGDQPTLGVANLVATAAIRDQQQANGSTATTGADGATPTLEDQIDQLESMDDAEVAAVVERVLAADGTEGVLAQRLLPRGYEVGTATADARLLLLVTQRTDTPVRTASAVSEEVAAGQVAVRDLATRHSGPETYRTISAGLVGLQETAAVSDSMSIVGPLALLFVLIALTVAYRDPLDVALGLFGVVVVLVWTFGTMGWLSIDFNQVMIAVPILLVGLSVDYAFHVVMRYREEQATLRDRSGTATAGDCESHDEADSVRTAMRRTLVGIGVALALVTLTTAVRFLATSRARSATSGPSASPQPPVSERRCSSSGCSSRH